MRERSRSPPMRGQKRSRSRSASPSGRRGWAPTELPLPPPPPSSAAAEARELIAAAVGAADGGGFPGPPPGALPGPPPVQFPGPPPLDPTALLPLVPVGSGGGLATAAGAGAAPRPSAQEAAARKLREIYVGNLAVGQTTADVLRELFDKALVGFVDNPAAQRAVVEVKMDPAAGRFAFVELLTEELATRALALDRTEVFGKGLKLARPQGYVAPADKPTSDRVAYAQQLAAKLAGGATCIVLLEGLVDASDVADGAERQEITEMVYEEALRCGAVRGIAVPLAPLDAPAGTPCRVYVRYATAADAAKCKDMMDGRRFDDRAVTADFATEVEYERAAKGEWFTGSIPDEPAAPGAAPGAPPGAPPGAGLLGAAGSGALTGLPTITPGASLTGLPTIAL